jgi:ABC-type branched-subunit amino acid transport system ATPase component
VVPELPVLSNLLMVPRICAVPLWKRVVRARGWADRVEEARDSVARSLADFGCGELLAKLARPGRELSFGWKRVLLAFRAHISDAPLILLDEPFAGLDPAKTAVVQQLMAQWRQQSRTVLFIEHIRSAAMRATIEQAAVRMILLDGGRIALDGSPQEVLASPTFSRAYTGVASSRGAVARDGIVPSVDGGRPVLEVSGLSASYGGVPALRGVNLAVAAGEHVLVVGPNGAGKSTLMCSILGTGIATTGTVRLRGRDVGGLRPFDIARLGVSAIPQRNRVFPDLPVRRNFSIAVSMLPARERRGRIAEALGVFPGLERLMKQKAGALSGGEQAELAVALALVQGPAVLLADEISVGLDFARAREVVRVLRGRLATGLALVSAEQFYQLSLEICDRVLALREGATVWQGPPQEFGQDRQTKLFSGLPL